MIQNNKKIIGLTGNSGSGKSTIREILKSYSYVIDADKIARSVLNLGTDCYNEVVDFFGDNILNEDYSIDRKKLGSIVFTDKKKLDKLSEITHKYVINLIINEIEYIKNNLFEYNYIVLDVPILIGNELEKISDEIWVVYAKKDTLVKRIMKRDNITYYEAINRLEKQSSLDFFKQYADFLIENENKSIEELSLEILERLHQ